MSSSNLILAPIANSLSSQFVKWESMAEILSLSYTMQKPCILYGRGGHGKSEMVRAAMSALCESKEDVFIQGFGEGMTEAALYGGLNLKALNCAENPRMEYNGDRSFLTKEFVLFEELFDAPTCVLLSLKDTLMSKRLNNGAQSIPMQTRLLVAATNKQPSEVAELGDSAQALIERFPLQLCVEWNSYELKDYEEMFDKVESNRREPVILASSIKGLLASMIAESVKSGEWISPRGAIACLDCVRASATINGRDEAIEEDIIAIKFIPGTARVLQDLDEKLKRLKLVAQAQSQLRYWENCLNNFKNELEGANNPIKCLKIFKKGQAVEKELQSFQVPDELVKRRDEIRKGISTLLNDAQHRAIATTTL